MNRLFASFLTLVALSGCSDPPAPPPPPSGLLRFAGSNTVYDAVVQIAPGFRQRNPRISVRISGDGTARGIKWAGEERASGLDMPLTSRAFSIPDGNTGPTTNGERVDFGMSSRELFNSEREAYTTAVTHAIAFDGIAVITHPGLGAVRNLTLAQLRDIFAGRVTRWSEVGGPDAPVRVVVRDAISGTAGAWSELVMRGAMITTSATSTAQPADMIAAVNGSENSIGYLSFAHVTPMTRTISIDGVAPTEESVARQRYPIRRPILLVTNGAPSALESLFLDYTRTPEAVAGLRMRGFVPAAATDGGAR